MLESEHATITRWEEDPGFCQGGDFCLNGIALYPKAGIYVSHVAAAPELMRIAVRPDGMVGPVIPINVPRC